MANEGRQTGHRQRESIWRILTRNPGPSWREYWNIWWTLTVLSGVIGLVSLVLEYLGVFGDLGLLLGAGSIIVTLLLGLPSLYFGMAASTQSSIREVRADLRALRADLQVGQSRLADGLDRLVTGQDGLVAGQDRLVAGQDRLVAGQDRVVAILDERLPRPGNR
jgi:hypothetical protein